MQGKIPSAKKGSGSARKPKDARLRKKECHFGFGVENTVVEQVCIDRLRADGDAGLFRRDRDSRDTQIRLIFMEFRKKLHNDCLDRVQAVETYYEAYYEELTSKIETMSRGTIEARWMQTLDHINTELLKVDPDAVDGCAAAMVITAHTNFSKHPPLPSRYVTNA